VCNAVLILYISWRILLVDEAQHMPELVDGDILDAPFVSRAIWVKRHVDALVESIHPNPSRAAGAGVVCALRRDADAHISVRILGDYPSRRGVLTYGARAFSPAGKSDIRKFLPRIADSRHDNLFFAVVSVG
jgi:hypothetical protein